MKSIEQTLTERKSYRKFSEKKLKYNELNEILKLAQRTASSVNGQQISIVVTDEQEKLDKISAIGWGQEHIKTTQYFLTFVIDYNRPSGVFEDKKDFIIHENIEGLLVGAVDAGLMAQSVELLLQSKGVGTCMIGGVRNDMVKLSEILNISGKAVPILGMTVAYPVISEFENDLRPRTDFNSFVFKEKYNKKVVEKGAIEYNEVLNSWWDERNMKGHRTYKESMNSFYSKNYIPDEFEQLQKLGFLKQYKKNEE